MVEHPEIRLMICDDDRSFRRLLSEAFDRSGGYTVSDTADLDELVHAISVRPADVVLVDLYQRRVARFDAAQRVREVTPDARVILLTYSAFDGDVKRALELGGTRAFDGYLTKDMELDEIESAIKNVTQGIRYLDPRIAGAALPSPSDLSPSELAALQALADGSRLDEVGEVLAPWSRTGKPLSARQVRRVTSTATAKLQARTLLEAVSIAHRRRLIS